MELEKLRLVLLSFGCFFKRFMEKTIFDKAVDYLLGQADKVTAWIGVIILLLALGGFYTLLLVLSVALIVLPETNFSEMFKKWTQYLRDKNKPL